MEIILLTLKLFLSTLVGFFIGLERKKRDKVGGSRTFALISLGASLIAILTLEIMSLNKDTNTVFNFSRLMAYGIASIGFLGGGMVIQTKNEIQGLTSAAVLYALVPIGFCFGLGYFYIGLISSILLYIILEMKYWFNED